MSYFFRLTTEEDKGCMLRNACKNINNLIDDSKVFAVDPKCFTAIPGSPFAYWVSSSARGKFAETQNDRIFFKQGIATADDFRFLRSWWEISRNSKEYLPIAKGGHFSPWYYDLDLVVNWESEGAQIKSFPKSRPQNIAFFRRAGITWPFRTQKGLNTRSLPSGSAFTIQGMAAFCEGDDPDELLILLALTNSTPFKYLLLLLVGFFAFQTGPMSRVPRPTVTGGDRESLLALARRAWQIKYLKDSSCETSHAFLLPSILLKRTRKLQEHSLDEELARIEKEIDKVAFKLYNFSHHDQSLAQELHSTALSCIDDDNSGHAQLEDVEELGAELGEVDGFLSWAIGVVFGRFSLKSADSMQVIAKLPDPFDPLPCNSPAMLEATELPYHVNQGIFLDTQTGTESLPAQLQELAKKLNISIPLDIRSWLRSDFFKIHLSLYSRSRRNAPIYWQLSAGSASVCIWLYYSSLSRDTAYLILREFVRPGLESAQRDIFDLQNRQVLSPDDSELLVSLESTLSDFQLLSDELNLVAPIWNPNLNDGVIINHAILWRITPYTPWQKKCMECWDKLVKGDYDWAHLAFHLWPERVIPKCTTDRSLAIAHGLEERLWQETNNGNWLPRQLSEADLQALIAEHSNPAVKSALERFLAAPPPVAPTRTRASRSTRASGSSTPRRARGSAAVVDAEATRQVLLALSAAPSDGLAKTQIADLIGVEANALTAVIKQLKESGQIDQLGERRGARYVLSEQGRAAVASQAGEDD